MSNEKRETADDIIAEMRALSNPISDGIIAINGRSIADRLEAAWKREKAEAEANALAVGGVVEASRATAEKSSVAGDTAKLRKACQKTRDLLMLRGDGKTMCILTWDEFNDTQKMLRSALAAPARNCDVGTAEEQTRRMEAEYCHVQKSCYESPSGRECPLHKAEVDCRLIWAQMPYREGGAS